MYSVKDKLMVRGAEALSASELLSLMLDDLSCRESVVEAILELCGGDIEALSTVEYGQLRMVEGLGAGRAARIVAACELARRSMGVESPDFIITSTADVAKIFRPKVLKLQHEECWAVHLNSANRMVELQRVSQGGVTSTIVDSRLIIRRSLELLTTQIILVHNHPSGSVTPSQEDVNLTKELKSAAALFDIKLLDHVIVSAESEYSLASAGLL